MTMTSNILAPGLVATSFGTVNYFNEANIIPTNASIRVTKTISISGSTTYYLTSDETITGNPLFNTVLFCQAVIFGNPGVILSAFVEVNSNTEVNIYVYDQSGSYGASIDVQLLIIGESAV